MHRAGLAAIVLAVAAGGHAQAETLGVHDLYRQAEALVQSIFGPAVTDHEVVTPPRSIDSRMALAPPKGGTLRLIEPSKPFKQR